MSYFKQIMAEIHKNNFIFPHKTIYLSQTMLNLLPELKLTPSEDGTCSYLFSDRLIFKAGAYLLTYNNKQFIIIKDDNNSYAITIYNDFTCATDSGKYIQLYEVKIKTIDSDGIYNINNISNTNDINTLIIGNTTINRSNLSEIVNPDEPDSFVEMRNITIQSSDSKNNIDLTDSKLIFESSYFLNYLNSAVADYAIINNGLCTIINQIGRLIFTGNELWELADTQISNITCVKLKLSSIYTDFYDDTDTDYIKCTHFSSILYSNFYNLSSINNICGRSGYLYFKIANTCLETNDLEGFKNFLKKNYKAGSPVTVLFRLAEPKIKNISVNDNSLETFFPATYYKTNYPNNVALCSNAIYLKDENGEVT